jgi:hypothetical protein
MDSFVGVKKSETASESQIKQALDQMPKFGTPFLSYTQACKVIQLGAKRIRSLYLTKGLLRFLLQVCVHHLSWQCGKHRLHAACVLSSWPTCLPA